MSLGLDGEFGFPCYLVTRVPSVATWASCPVSLGLDRSRIFLSFLCVFVLIVRNACFVPSSRVHNINLTISRLFPERYPVDSDTSPDPLNRIIKPMLSSQSSMPCPIPGVHTQSLSCSSRGIPFHSVPFHARLILPKPASSVVVVVCLRGVFGVVVVVWMVVYLDPVESFDAVRVSRAMKNSMSRRTRSGTLPSLPS